MTDIFNLLDTLTVVAIMSLGRYFLQGNNSMAIYLFSFAVLFFGFIGALIPDNYGYFYYLFAAATDLAIIYALSLLTSPTKLIAKLQNACIVFVALNAYGWVVYMLYITPISYNLLCLTTYIWVYFTILTGEDNHVVGNTSMGRWIPSFLSHSHSLIITYIINHRRIIC